MSKRIAFSLSSIVCQKIGSSLNALADLFFPPACFGCGKSSSGPSVWLCSTCEKRVPLFYTQRCFLCSKNITRYGEACFQCADIKEHPLDAVFAATCYQLPVIKRMIHSYKYQFVERLSITLGNLLGRVLEQSALPLPDVLVPVPLHSKRLRYRGFNQSALLAYLLTQEVTSLSAIPVNNSLERHRFTLPQQKTHSKSERTTNLTGAFVVAPGAELKGKKVWLIDDVATTKSTLTECAQVLKNSGVKKVYAVVLAQD